MRPKLTILVGALVLASTAVAAAQDGQMLTDLENEMRTAAAGWESRIMQAARSMFWILAGIEVGIAAIWLAIQAASLDSWFAELVRRILFIGFFLFVLEQGPDLAKAVVDSLFQIGANGGSASPANIFNAGLGVASQLSANVQFGLFEDNALAIAAVFAMIVVVVSFALVAAIFISIMVEMYVGLLAGMIMLGLGGTSFTKNFAVRYLVYAFSVGMKLMALVMIARIGSDVLIGMTTSPTSSDEFLRTLATAGISVVVFMISMYVPSIIQGVVQGISVSGGMEAIRHGGQSASFALGAGSLGADGARVGGAAYTEARQGGASFASAAMKGVFAGIGATGSAVGSAAKDQAIGAPGSYGSTTLGLANAKLDAGRATLRAGPPSGNSNPPKP